jgi:hypothetical protein
VPDVPVMKVVGLAFAVADAHRDAIRAAHIVLTTPGGYGAVREVCDFLLDARRDAKKGRQRRILTGPIARSGNAVPNSRVVRSRRVIPKGRRDVTQLAK